MRNACSSSCASASGPTRRYTESFTRFNGKILSLAFSSERRTQHEGRHVQTDALGPYYLPRGLRSIVWLGPIPITLTGNVGVGTATPDEALALALSPGARVSRLRRLRLADGKPMCVEQASLPYEHLPDPETVERSLYAVLEQRGSLPVRALQRLRAQPLDEEHARLLHVTPGAACLYIERRSFLTDGRPVEFVRSYYRGDSYDFVAELHV